MYPYKTCPHCSQEDVSPWYNPCEYCHGTGLIIRSERELRFHRLLQGYKQAEDDYERDRIEEELLTALDKNDAL